MSISFFVGETLSNEVEYEVLSKLINHLYVLLIFQPDYYLFKNFIRAFVDRFPFASN
jgi:hypothetical protein